ncbi:hypothetical protein IKE72_02875 [Candidatus Saccharibacteria bacterium]|nr:hypothetical protein [Candidatus Saccharibacteria bacterium]
MKRIRIIALLFSLVPSILSLSPVYATSRVEFAGGAEDFVFHPSGDWTDTDLFGGLKDIMPGDTRTETIEIRNSSKEYNYVNIYLRAIPHDTENPLSESVSEREDLASMQDFLSQLQLTVMNGDKIISDDSADVTAGLTENVLLGHFQKDATASLNVVLQAPLTMSNDYAYRAGEIDWVFTAEGYEPITAPDTGLGALMSAEASGPMISLVIISLIATIYIIYRYYKRKNRKNAKVIS